MRSAAARRRRACPFSVAPALSGEVSRRGQTPLVDPGTGGRVHAALGLGVVLEGAGEVDVWVCRYGRAGSSLRRVGVRLDQLVELRVRRVRGSTTAWSASWGGRRAGEVMGLEGSAARRGHQLGEAEGGVSSAAVKAKVAEAEGCAGVSGLSSRTAAMGGGGAVVEP